METRIGHLHITYRVPQTSSSASLLLPALERVAQSRIAAVCDQTFAKTFADDPTVFVLRTVSTRLAIVNRPDILESHIAEQWGRHLCLAVMKSLSEEDSGNLVRFTNQAEFVASFLIELTKGDPWSKWYYRAFVRYREMSVAEAVIDVLDENKQWTPEIFSRLRQDRELETLLASLGNEHKGRLWNEVVRGTRRQDSREAFEIFVSSALSLLDSLDLWSSSRPAEESILKSYLDSGPAAPQWTNIASLADAVAEVVQFVVSAGWISVSDGLDADRVARFERALARNFDWLDVPRLSSRVLSILQTKTPVQPARGRFLLRPSSLTATQKQLLEKLAFAIGESKSEFDFNDEDLHANLLRLLSLLPETGLSSAEAITPLLENIVAVWIALRRNPYSREVIAKLYQASTLIQPGLTNETHRQLEIVAAKGVPAVAVVEQLLKVSAAIADDDVVLMETDCAGLFLLVRTLQDVRLTAILHECDFKPLESLLTGLAISLGGNSSWKDQAIDRGAAMWAGIEPSEAAEKLKLLETLDRERFEAAFDELLLAQRVEQPNAPATFDGEVPVSCEVLSLLHNTARKILCAWARWLPGLSHSSAPFLNRNFIWRSGTIAVSSKFLEVKLEPGSLDTVLRMAGYLDETPEVAWLGNRRVRFQIGD